MVNFDPANDATLYTADYDVSKVIDFQAICEETRIGPNGAFLKAIEMLHQKVDLMNIELKAFDQDSLFIFDCPGQVELFTTCESLVHIVQGLNFRFSVVNVVDGCHCQDGLTFVSSCLITLQSMLHLGLPQINILSKIDLLTAGLDAPLATYCYAELSSLLHGNEPKSSSKFRQLTHLICQLIEDFSSVIFIPLAIEDRRSIVFVASELDRITGHVFGGLFEGNDSIQEAVYSEQCLTDYIAYMDDKYLKHFSPESK